MTTTTAPILAAVRGAQVNDLPPEVVARVSGAVEALAEALGEMANSAEPAFTESCCPTTSSAV